MRLPFTVAQIMVWWSNTRNYLTRRTIYLSSFTVVMLMITVECTHPCINRESKWYDHPRSSVSLPESTAPKAIILAVSTEPTCSDYILYRGFSDHGHTGRFYYLSTTWLALSVLTSTRHLIWLRNSLQLSIRWCCYPVPSTSILRTKPRGFIQTLIMVCTSMEFMDIISVTYTHFTIKR